MEGRGANLWHRPMQRTPPAPPVPPASVALMECESVNLEREFRIAEKACGTDHLDAVLINGYIGKLLSNVRVVRYLAQHYGEILAEFQKLCETKTAAA